MLALLIDPALRPTQEVPSDRPLEYLEKLYAALLLVAQSWRVPLKEMVERIEALRQCWEPEMEVVVNKLRALQALLFVFCPAMFAIAALVRKCSWEGTASGNGKWARKCPSYCLIVLMELYGSDAHKVEYVQSLCKTLLTLQDWQDLTPARVFVEEQCEAMLSTLRVQCELHAENTSVEGVQDLFRTPPPIQDVRLICCNISRDTVRRMGTAVRTFVHKATLRDTPFGVWGSAKVQRHDEWDCDYQVPKALHVDMEYVRRIMGHGLKLLMQPKEVDVDINQFLRTHVPTANRAAIDGAERALGRVRRLPEPVEPRRVRVHAPPPATVEDRLVGILDVP